MAEVSEGGVGSPRRPGCHGDVSDEVDQEIQERKERRRKKIIDELFETEKTYLHHLDLAHKFFEFPLRFNCLVSDRAHSQLFSNLEQILEVNTKLLEYMEQTTVGNAFKFLGPFLKLYSMYANNHRQASVTLEENLQKNEPFAEFIKTQEERSEVMGLKIGALLITPVQRIPRYKLLLEDLLENTNQNHHDYSQLKEAAKQVGDIAMHINEHVRQNENFMKMLEIQNSFDSSAPKILTPGREFIKEGKLTKMSRKGGKSMERMFFLFSDLIVYGKPKLLDSGKHSFSCCCMLPLRHCQVEKVLGSVLRSDGGGMFRISCKEENLLLHCNDAQDALRWVEVIEAAIRKLNVNRQTLRKPSSNKVPVRGKSLMKMRLRERKKDSKKKPTATMPGKKTDSPIKSPLRVLADVDVSNCLTPRRSSKLSESEVVEGSYLQDCNSENEINLDDWDPNDENSNQNNSSDDDDDNDIDTINENDESGDNDSLPGLTIENPPYPKTLDFDYLAPSSDKTKISGKRKFSANGYDEIDSPQFYDPKVKKSKESSVTCSTGPFKRVTKVTSSIGEMMDNVRSHKSCNLM